VTEHKEKRESWTVDEMRGKMGDVWPGPCHVWEAAEGIYAASEEMRSGGTDSVASGFWNRETGWVVIRVLD
jgi:hypothetical protein